MGKSTILVQLDTDPHPSLFDSVVAIDAGTERLLTYGAVAAGQIRDLVYGAIFTRGVEDLRHTAIFIGGSNVAAGESLLSEVRKTFFGPMRVSVMLDSNGANTTAAAAALVAASHMPLSGTDVLVLAGTGPVGSRVVRLLAAEGARVHVASRDLAKAERVCGQVAARIPDAKLVPRQAVNPAQAALLLEGVQMVVSAGAPGVELLTADARRAGRSLRLAIDLSAVPPLGLAGIEATDRATEREGVVCYGAIGAGATKMKIHKAAIKQLFRSNDQVLDAEEIYSVGRDMISSP